MTFITENRTKARLAAGDMALGLVVRQARTVDIAGISQACDYDWISLDLEHSSLDLDTAAQIAYAALGVGLTPIVRSPSKHHYHATRLLDAGAQGVIVPHIDTRAEAEEMTVAFKYPPAGKRSLASVQPQLSFRSHPVDVTMEAVNRETLLIAMLESSAAIANADEIASVEGIDVLLVGTGDLCADMGVPGDVCHPKVEEAYRHVIEVCQARGIHVGMAGIHDHAFAAMLVASGVRLITAGTDLNFLMAGARQRSASLRALLPSGK